MFKLIKLATILLVLLCLPYTTIAEESTKRTVCNYPFLGFSLKISNNFEAIDQKIPGIICSLREKNSGYPSFTVTTQPTPFKARPGKSLKEAVLESYQGVGLTDVDVEEEGDFSSLQLESQIPKNSPLLTVNYTLSGVRYTGLVLIINQPEFHMILTFIERHGVVDAYSFKEAFRGLLAGIKGNFNQGAEKSTAITGEFKSGFWIVVLLMGLLVFTIYSWIKKAS